MQRAKYLEFPLKCFIYRNKFSACSVASIPQTSKKAHYIWLQGLVEKKKKKYKKLIYVIISLWL
jgi:hypothetical protein